MNFYRTKSNSSFDHDVDQREKKITRVLSNYQCCSPSNLTLIQSPRSAVITTDSIERLSLSTSSSKTIDEQLDAIDFLGKYLEHANRDILVDFFSDMARAIRSHPTNLNHHLECMSNRQTNLQRSNNKEKKTKWTKSDFTSMSHQMNLSSRKESKRKEKRTLSIEWKLLDDEAKEKKLKKKSEKKKHLDESTSSSEVNTTDSPIIPIAQHSQSKSPKYSSLSTAGSSPYPTLTIPVPQPNFSMSPSPSPSPLFIPQRSNGKHLFLSFRKTNHLFVFISMALKSLNYLKFNNNYKQIHRHQPINEFLLYLTFLLKNNSDRYHRWFDWDIDDKHLILLFIKGKNGRWIVN